MKIERKTFSGIMNLDDPREVFPPSHHREAKNGVFRGNGTYNRYESIRGNQESANRELITNNCTIRGVARRIDCGFSGIAVKVVSDCMLLGNATKITVVDPNIAVSSVGAFSGACIGGTIDEYMTAYIGLNNIVVSDTTFELEVKYVYSGNTCTLENFFYAYFTLVVPAGSNGQQLDMCTQGAYVGFPFSICSTCVVSCSNPAINISSFDC
jgi:hypothetical protein